MIAKLNAIPDRFVALILIAMLLIGVFLGNRNALNNGLASADARLPAVREVMTLKAGQAANLAVLCERHDLKTQARDMLNARNALLSANTAASIARANADFTAATDKVQIMLKDKIFDETQRKLLTSIDDELISAQNRFKREAQLYNQCVVDARAVYQKLPMRFLLKSPEGFNI